MYARLTRHLALYGSLLAAGMFLGCDEAKHLPIAEVKVKEKAELAAGGPTARAGLDEQTIRLFFPELHEREMLADVPGFLPRDAIDELVKEVQPGMTVEQMSVVLGLQPDDYAFLDKKDKRQWTIRCTDISGHGCFNFFDARFNEGKFVEGTLWAGPF